MPITGVEFKSYAESLNKRLAGKHISRPILVSRSTLFFHLSGNGDHRFTISLDSNNPRAYTATNEYNLVSLDSPIYLAFRKELANAFVESVGVENDDRILRFDLVIVNRVYKEEKRILLFEMFPSHPNLILLDESKTIIAFTHASSLDSSRPILKGMVYEPPKKHFLDKEKIFFDYPLYQKTCLETERQIFDERKKERFWPLLTQLTNQEKRLKNKLKSIEKDKEKAESHRFDNVIGDYIFTNLDSLAGQDELLIEGKKISLDGRKNLVQNANDFYKKSKKAKKAMIEIERQKDRAEKELLSVQESIKLLKNSDEEGLESFAKQWSLLDKKKDKIDFGTANIPYEIEKNSTRFLFGKNARQNDTLTFLIDTVKTHYWFHVSNKEGAHVMIKKENPDSDEIKTACEIALLSVKEEDGDIVMSERKNIYKGGASGQVILREYQTIHLKNVRKETKTLFENAKKMKLK